MKIPKQYFRDRVLLLVLSLNIFLVFVTLLAVLFGLGNYHSDPPIVQYRQNHLGGSDFGPGSISQLYGFALFALAVLVINLILSMRMYRVHRQLSVVVLGMGTLLLIFDLVVGNQLLVLG